MGLQGTCCKTRKDGAEAKEKRSTPICKSKSKPGPRLQAVVINVRTRYRTNVGTEYLCYDAGMLHYRRYLFTISNFGAEPTAVEITGKTSKATKI